MRLNRGLPSEARAQVQYICIKRTNNPTSGYTIHSSCNCKPVKSDSDHNVICLTNEKKKIRNKIYIFLNKMYTFTCESMEQKSQDVHKIKNIMIINDISCLIEGYKIITCTWISTNVVTKVIYENTK